MSAARPIVACKVLLEGPQTDGTCLELATHWPSIVHTHTTYDSPRADVQQIPASPAIPRSHSMRIQRRHTLYNATGDAADDPGTGPQASPNQSTAQTPGLVPEAAAVDLDSRVLFPLAPLLSAARPLRPFLRVVLALLPCTLLGHLRLNLLRHLLRERFERFLLAWY